MDRAASAMAVLALLPVVVTAIVRPVRALTRTMAELAAGNLATEAEGQERRDELGDMARAVLVFKEHMLHEKRLAEEKLAAQNRAEADKQAALLGMAETIENETAAAAADRRANDGDGGDGGHDESAAARTGGSARNAAVAAEQALANARPSRARPSNSRPRSARSAPR